MRERCPLAPSLFLFFAKAMRSLLTGHETPLQGLCLPVREEELLDAEFANHTAMYFAGQEVNLSRFQTARDVL